MRRLARGAVLAAFMLAAAYDIGVFIRADYMSEEPLRDIGVGLVAVAGIAAAGWALAEPNREGADVDR
jgi:hypothetical protein